MGNAVQYAARYYLVDGGRVDDQGSGVRKEKVGMGVGGGNDFG